MTISALGLASPVQPGKVAHVELLGTGARLRWIQNADGLHIELPEQYVPPVDYSAVFRVRTS